MTKKRVVILILALLVQLGAFSVGSALADTYSVGYSMYANGLNGNPPLSDRCFYIKVELRHPSVSQSYTLDYNTYNRSRWQSGCTQAYSRPASYLAVKGSFVYIGTITSSGGVCSYFNWVTNNASTADFGIGAGVANPANTCAGGSGGTYHAAGNAYRIINGNTTYAGTYTTNNHYFP